ncbi:MAG: hypothetical protein JSU96_16860 [Acidobacteriota bacterium]|nr:MAG: hypothetical protein JSU96_16860 [Acidobacteriota bacterium]
MYETQLALIERILNSAHFKRAPKLSAILRFICLQTIPHASAAVSEYDIAIQALKRPDSFDPRIDPIVRVNLANIRQRLERYFLAEGSQEELRLEIPKGEYRVVFSDREGKLSSEVSASRTGGTLGLFWKPYLSGTTRNLFLFTELLFLGNDEGTHIRNIFCNDVDQIKSALSRQLDNYDLGHFRPSFRYVSAGDAQCALTLTSMFASMGVLLEPTNVRFSSWKSICDVNAIVVGTCRSNHFLDSLQGDEDFVFERGKVVNRNPRDGEEASYGLEWTAGNPLVRDTDYAIVTRRPSIGRGKALTLIAANQGPAVEAVTDYLTQERSTKDLLRKARLRGKPGSLPAHFQVLFRIDRISNRRPRAKATYLSSRIY